MAAVKIVYLLDTDIISTAFIPINNFISKHTVNTHTVVAILYKIILLLFIYQFVTFILNAIIFFVS